LGWFWVHKISAILIKYPILLWVFFCAKRNIKKVPLFICSCFLKIKLDDFDFLSSSNLIFSGYAGSKNQVQTRQKTKFIRLDVSNSIFQKSIEDKYGKSLHVYYTKELINIKVKEVQIFA
jgi:hypothetical protein